MSQPKGANRKRPKESVKKEIINEKDVNQSNFGTLAKSETDRDGTGSGRTNGAAGDVRSEL